MKQEMTSRERMRCALTGGIPDRVPAAPDISTMVPCKLSGHTFTDVLLRNKPPLWKAYLQAIRHFGMDGWFTYGELDFKMKKQYTETTREYRDGQGLLHVQHCFDTPAGTLTRTYRYFDDDCCVPTEKLIKNFKEDFPKFKYLFPEITGYDDSLLRQQEKELGEQGIMAVGIYPPGMHMFCDFFDGGLENVIYAYYDEPELFQELNELYAAHVLRQAEMILDAKPDSILTGGSGSITMQSPEIWEELALPTLRKIVSMASQAGVISGVHSCGKERHLVRVMAETSELNYVNPLEISPGGDCDLAELKASHGSQIAFMGNLQTTGGMLMGDVKKVRRESLRAIRDAGQNGGFVLSTGDQVPRDTPEENIFEMVNVVREFGQYPLNLDKIEEELKRLEN